MAAHSNRSPSPVSSKHINANPIISESNPAIRRSFIGKNGFMKPSVITSNTRRFDPVTPANSPSDFPRRRSVGKEFIGSNLKDCDEKENEEKDLNSKAATKLRSPAKGSKNFMAPTISAASKFTPSPRKKVLAERNDPLRTSISLSDGKVMFFSSMGSNDSEVSEAKSEMGFDQNRMAEASSDMKAADAERKEAVHEDPLVPKPSKKVAFVNFPSYSHDPSEPLQESEIIESSDSLKSMASCSSPLSNSIAPLDADPSLPPYDPKTNYLSPRPQFLHYKPNPRIEILLNKEKGLDPDEFKLLDDGFMEIMSESFSDSEATDESQTEYSQEKELEVTAASDMVLGVEEETVTDPDLSEPSETLPVSTTVTDAISVENSVEMRGKKPRNLSKLISFSIVMLFLVSWVSISVNHSPAFDHIVIKDLSFSDVSNFYHESSFAASAREKFLWFARHVNQLSADSLSFLSKLIDKLGNGVAQGPLKFVNLTELQEDIWNGGQFLNNQFDKGLAKNVEEEEMEEDVEEETDVFEEEAFAEVDFDENFEEEVSSEDDTSETKGSSPDSVVVSEPENFQVHEEEDVVSCSSNDEQWNHDNSQMLTAVEQDQSIQLEVEKVEIVPQRAENEELHDDKTLASDKKILIVVETVEIESGGSEAEKFHCDNNNLGSSVIAETALLEDQRPLGVEFTSEDIHGSVSMESPLENSDGNPFTRLGAVILPLFVALLAAAAFLYRVKRNSCLSNAVMNSDSLLKNKTGHEYAATKLFHQEKPFSSHNLQTDIDLISESCPSEMSSFQKSASAYSMRRAGEAEAQSSENKMRKNSKRESLASSSGFSMDTPSYGSFTTFERIPIKHANGDEEIITPVRRSSRIRHQVTSP